MRRSRKKIRAKSLMSPSNALMLEPWFLPRRIAYGIRALIPAYYKHRMRHFFEDYGCLVCMGDREYLSNGMCRNCYNKTCSRIRASMRHRKDDRPSRSLD